MKHTPTPEALHSLWSASGFEQKMLCPGSLVMQEGLPDTSSVYADEGTAAHQVLTWVLQEGNPASHYVGRNITVNENVFEVDEDMAGFVQTTADLAYELAGTDGEIFADIRVNYNEALGVDIDDAWGTADIVILHAPWITVIDFKYGRGVTVEAGHDLGSGRVVLRNPNPQMGLYALGAAETYNDNVLGDEFDKVRMIISQPRVISEPSMYELPLIDLQAWAHNTARSAVRTCLNASTLVADPAWAETFLHPGEKQCKFCRAKATCSELSKTVSETIGNKIGAATNDEFDVVSTDIIGRAPAEHLGFVLSKVDLIEDWCKAVRAETERRMLAGETIPGYKLVQGKKGNRAWTDPAAAEEMLKAMRLKVEEMYTLKVISPTAAEKLAPKQLKKGEKPDPAAPKPIIGPRQWPKLKELITQTEGKLHVAPVSDKRLAVDVRPVADDFEALPAPGDDDDFV